MPVASFCEHAIPHKRQGFRSKANSISLLITRTFELALQKNLVATLPRVRTCGKRQRTTAMGSLTGRCLTLHFVAKCAYVQEAVAVRTVPPPDLKTGECQMNSQEAVPKILAWTFGRAEADWANPGRFYIPNCVLIDFDHL